MNSQKRGRRGAAFGELFNNQAGIQAAHAQTARCFRRVHTHKAQLTRGAQGLFGKD